MTWTVISVALSFAAVLIAGFAFDFSRKTLHASTFCRLFDRYATPEMANDLRTLRQWREDYCDGENEFAQKWLQAVQDRTDVHHQRAGKVDAARRRVLYHFLTCWYMRDRRAMSERLFKVLVNKQSGELFVKVAVPLTEKLGPESQYKPAIDDIIERLHLSPNEPPTSKIASIPPLDDADEPR